MKYVLDSCVAFKWIVTESDTDKALRIRDDFRAAVHDLSAPDFFPLELGHALTRAERQGRVTPPQGWTAWLSLMSDCPKLAASIPLMPRAYNIASAIRISLYDSLYIALAEREGCQLLTSDDKLVRSVQPSFPFVVSLASRP